MRMLIVWRYLVSAEEHAVPGRYLSNEVDKTPTAALQHESEEKNVMNLTSFAVRVSPRYNIGRDPDCAYFSDHEVEVASPRHTGSKVGVLMLYKLIQVRECIMCVSRKMRRTYRDHRA